MKVEVMFSIDNIAFSAIRTIEECDTKETTEERIKEEAHKFLLSKIKSAYKTERYFIL